MLVIRKIAFYVFLLLYLVLCPLTVFSTLGYVVQPGTEQGITKAGLISVSTTPTDASIYLEKRRYATRTPTVIEGLLPGDYHLTLVLKDHEPWIGRVSVEAARATVLDKVLLLSKAPERGEVFPDTFEDLVPVPDTRFVLLLKGPKLEDLVVADWATAERWPLIPPGSPFRGGQIASSAIVPNSSFLLVRVRFRDGEKFLGVELGRGQPRVADLTSLFPSRPLWVEWDPRTSHQLFAIHEGYVNRVQRDSLAIYPRIVERMRGCGVANNALYVLTDELMVQRVDREGKPLDVLFDDLVAGRALFGSTGIFRITVLPDDVVLLLGERGELLATRRPYRLVEGGVRGLAVDRERKRLLVWRKDKLGVVGVAASDEDDLNAARELSIRWVFQEGKDIDQAVWVHQGSHVLFRDRDIVSLLELEPQGATPLRRLVQVRPRSSIAYAEGSGRLYYLDRETRRLSWMQIVPRKALPFLPSPERREEKT